MQCTNIAALRVRKQTVFVGNLGEIFFFFANLTVKFIARDACAKQPCLGVG